MYSKKKIQGRFNKWIEESEMISTLAKRKQGRLLYKYALSIEFEKQFKEEILYMKDIFKLDETYPQFLMISANIDMINTNLDIIGYDTLKQHYFNLYIFERLLKIKEIIIKNINIEGKKESKTELLMILQNKLQKIETEELL